MSAGALALLNILSTRKVRNKEQVLDASSLDEEPMEGGSRRFPPTSYIPGRAAYKVGLVGLWRQFQPLRYLLLLSHHSGAFTGALFCNFLRHQSGELIT